MNITDPNMPAKQRISDLKAKLEARAVTDHDAILELANIVADSLDANREPNPVSRPDSHYERTWKKPAPPPPQRQ